MTRRSLFGLLAGSAVAAPPPPPPAQRVLRVSVAADGAVVQKSLKASVVGGKPARVLRVRSPKEDLLLLVVMDVVGDLALVDPARNAIVAQLREMPRSVWTGLLRAQDGLQVVLDPTADRDRFAKALLEMPVTGKAGLLDTVETAVQLADSIAAKSTVRVAVLYITDSDVRNYREDFTNPVINSSDYRDLSRRFPEGLVREKVARMTETIASYQSPVFIVHLDYSSERLNQAYQSGLMQLASTTGGSATFCRSQADVAEVVSAAMNAAQSLHQVWVQLPPKSPTTVNLLLESEGQTLSHRSRFLLK